jgi:hypothetical protein
VHHQLLNLSSSLRLQATLLANHPFDCTKLYASLQANRFTFHPIPAHFNSNLQSFHFQIAHFISASFVESPSLQATIIFTYFSFLTSSFQAFISIQSSHCHTSLNLSVIHLYFSLFHTYQLLIEVSDFWITTSA